jgi:hypothetical protein
MKPRLVFVLVFLPLVQSFGEAASAMDHHPGHPRLYFTAAELPALRNMRSSGMHKRIWANVKDSADWCLTLQPRREWIAPITPDPIYENLYDRFYAIMGELAITEHLSFAYALSGEKRYGDAARTWALASCRAWKREADNAPDGGKAYAVTRLLKGIAVAYDAAYDQFSEAERSEIRTTLATIAEKHYAGYFTTPTISGAGFHTHHATVEWASFGVTALALLDEDPQAAQWLDATVKKFEEHLLPTGLAPDGAQVEGATFWASTMQYRLFFMDPLRRVTGKDLFKKYESAMNPDLALASVAARQQRGRPDEHQQNVILSPSYGQLDYYSPVLVALAREYRISTCQYLAQWDESLGALQKTRYRTPHGEQLLFELGGYAYVWCDETAPTKPLEKRLSFHFPSVDEAYVRAGWKPDGLVAGVRNGELVVHAGGLPVLIEPADWREPVAGVHTEPVEDNGRVATLRCTNGIGEVLSLKLDRSKQRVTIRRHGAEDWRWWCQGAPTRKGSELRWKTGVTVRVVEGELTAYAPAGYKPPLAVGFGKLQLDDPSPMAYPKCTVKPTPAGDMVVEVTQETRRFAAAFHCLSPGSLQRMATRGSTCNSKANRRCRITTQSARPAELR